jgi:UDP-glucose 4-epimerase
MHVLVTGGAGYIGSVMTARLLDGGHSVHVFDNLSTGHREAVDSRAGLTVGDLLDSSALDIMLAASRFDAVMHFAAEAAVEKSMTEPEAFYRTNVVGGLNLLDAMVRHRTPTLIFSSTCAVYGEPQFTPLTEAHRTAPINSYGDTKLAFERALRWYGEAHGIRHVSLRYFNVCGATDTLSENRAVETHLIPLAVDASLGRRELSVFGSDYPTHDGTCVRDYVHVSDIAEAHVAVLERMDRVKRPVYNVGTGTGFSNVEVVASARRVSGNDFPVRMAGRRPGDPAELVADASLFAAELGWSPRITNLDEIVASVWRARSRA